MPMSHMGASGATHSAVAHSHGHEGDHSIEKKHKKEEQEKQKHAPKRAPSKPETEAGSRPSVQAHNHHGAEHMTTSEYVKSYQDLTLNVGSATDTETPGKWKNHLSMFSKKRTSRAILDQVKQKDRTVWAVIYLHPAFENAAIILIVLNAIWIGMEVDMNRPNNRKVPKEFFEVGEIVFCILFSAELTVRFLAYKHKEQFFRDPDMKNWNIFDAVLVSAMVLDTIILNYVVQADASGLRFMSTLRLTRLLRISRIFRLLPELGLMVKSLLAAVRSVASTCCLGLGVMYIFAILTTQWAKSFGKEGKCIGDPGYEICVQEYFGELRQSFLTLFQFLGFDDTFEILKPIFRVNAMIGGLLVVYMLLNSFTILNMLIGIICDIVEESTTKEQKTLMRHKLEGMFSYLDSADTGSISKKEFDEKRTRMMLNSVGITPQFAINAFDILDSNRDGELQREEFIRMIFKCLQDPRSEDVLMLESKIDRVTAATGLTHDKTAVTQKERETVLSAREQVHHPIPAARAAAPEETAGSATPEVLRRDAKKRAKDRVNKEKWMTQRLKVLSKSIGNVSMLCGAGKIKGSTEVLTAGIGPPVGGQTWLQPFHTGDYNDAVQKPFPSPGLMTIMRPALRALHARLHALRAECRAFGMGHTGNVVGAQGQELIPRENLMPLEDLISEAILRLDAAGRSMSLPGFSAALPRAAPRQRAVLEQKDDVAILALEN